MNKITKVNSKLINIVLCVLSFVWLFPFSFALINAVKSGAEYNQGNFWDWPKGISISNSLDFISERVSLIQGFSNSLLYGVVSSSLAIVLAALAAFGVTKLQLKAKFVWFILIYSGTIFPFQTYLVPVYRMFSSLGLYDTQIG